MPQSAVAPRQASQFLIVSRYQLQVALPGAFEILIERDGLLMLNLVDF